MHFLSSALLLLIALCRAKCQIEISVVSTEQLAYGVGAFWDSEESVFYYTDKSRATIYRYEPSSNTTTSVQVGPGLTSIVIPVEGEKGLFVVSINLTMFLIEWDGVSSTVSSTTELFSVKDIDLTKDRFAGGDADSKGVLFAGTIAEGKNSPGLKVYIENLAARYRFKRENDNKCELSRILYPITASGGTAWNSDNTLMYYVNIYDRVVLVYDYDLETSELTNERIFFNLTANGYSDTAGHLVLPQDVVVDTEGNVFISVYGLGQVVGIRPNGTVFDVIYLPASILVTLAWGDEDLSTLYVTSVSDRLTVAERLRQPLAGSTFTIKGIGSKGITGGFKVDPICCR